MEFLAVHFNPGLLYASIFLHCILVVIGTRDMPSDQIKYLAFATQITIISFLLVKLELNSAVELPLIFAIQTIGFISVWWFILTLFDDSFRIGKNHIIIASVWIALHVLHWILGISGIEALELISRWTVNILGLILIIFASYRILVDLNNDLIPARRRLRVLIGIILTANYILHVIGNLVWDRHSVAAADWYRAIEISLIFISTFYCFYKLIKLDDKVLKIYENSSSQNPTEQQKSRLVALNLQIENGIYRNTRLSLKILSQETRIPEYELRRLIREFYGHRNFRVFLNSLRLKEAKELLANPDNLKTHVATVAFEVGFNSLASFYRAFSEAEGKTPTEYREEMMKRQKTSEMRNE